MGVNTKAIIRQGTSVTQIKESLERKYSEVEIRATHTDSFFALTFKDGGDNRQMFVHLDGAESDFGIKGTYLSLGFWGNSVQIMNHLLSDFGGYLMENDWDNEEFVPVNIEAYQQGEAFTQMDLFRNKVISELGYDTLDKAMKLFEEFKNIT